MGQVFQIQRTRTIGGRQTLETAYYVTSLKRSRANARRLSGLVRRHWGAIENGLHYVRDEAFGEDRSTICRGSAPQNLAALRNGVLNCLRQTQTGKVTATLRSFSRNSLRLLAIFGYPN